MILLEMLRKRRFENRLRRAIKIAKKKRKRLETIPRFEEETFAVFFLLGALAELDVESLPRSSQDELETLLNDFARAATSLANGVKLMQRHQREMIEPHISALTDKLAVARAKLFLKVECRQCGASLDSQVGYNSYCNACYDQAVG